jgi:hypothetical protein
MLTLYRFGLLVIESHCDPLEAGRFDYVGCTTFIATLAVVVYVDFAIDGVTFPSEHLSPERSFVEPVFPHSNASPLHISLGCVPEVRHVPRRSIPP